MATSNVTELQIVLFELCPFDKILQVFICGVEKIDLFFISLNFSWQNFLSLNLFYNKYKKYIQ